MRNVPNVLVGIGLLCFLPVGAASPVAGKVIALDAGHGGTETGAINVNVSPVVMEKDVNLAVVYKLKEKNSLLIRRPALCLSCCWSSRIRAVFLASSMSKTRFRRLSEMSSRIQTASSGLKR